MLPAIRNKRELSIVFNKELPKYLHKHEIDTILDMINMDFHSDN